MRKIESAMNAAPLAQQDTHATPVVCTKDLTVDEKVALADRLNLNGRIVVIDAVIAAYKEKNKYKLADILLSVDNERENDGAANQ